MKPVIHHVFGLGLSCHTAFFMNIKELRTCSMPLDWVATTKIDHLLDILASDFANMMNREYMMDHPDGSNDRAGHRKYHTRFFNHFNPRREDHYAYYQRCIDRFHHIKELPEDENILFLLMVHHDAYDQDKLYIIYEHLRRMCGGKNIYLCAIYCCPDQTRPLWRCYNHRSNPYLQHVVAKLRSSSLGWKFENDYDDMRLDKMVKGLYSFDIRREAFHPQVNQLQWESNNWK